MKQSSTLAMNAKFKNTNRRKLLIIPGNCQSLGGTLTSLSSLIAGFIECKAFDRICVLVQSDSLMEKYLTIAGHQACLIKIPAKNDRDFVDRALRWVNQQPKNYPLLLDNCVARELLPVLILASIYLRLSKRPIYHFCHDLALSHNRLGFLMRKFTFALLSPRALCNSYFTAQHIYTFMNDIRGILYQPVDSQRFYPRTTFAPPDALKPIIQSGAYIILNPSRITQAGIINDKKLRSLIEILAILRSKGHHYHLVLIGEDDTPDLIRVQELQAVADREEIAEWVTILPPTFEIERYYQHADLVVALAPREPFGRIVVEAIASGIPVIGSQTGGIGEILNHFAPNWVVDSDDVAAAAEKVIQVMSDPNTSHTLACGQKWVQRHCSLKTYAKHMMQLTDITPIHI